MIIGTAGHIDHGKSALVTALTGRPMDRLAEERRRGITIDLNFAPLELPGLARAGIVDVPGHEDFVRTMVAGASGIDLVLLVVDAVQGPEPQTWEHLAIVEQLRVPRGIPVITKADLAEPEWIELVALELEERLRRSPVAFEAPAIVSAVDRRGIPELLARLRSHAAAAERERPADGFRMPVDRAFSLAGVGTVVTGTPWSGSLRIGDQVTLHPSGVTARVRSLEAYGAPVETARPGARTAVGLAGVERGGVGRGESLVDERLPWRLTHALDVSVELLPGVPPLRPRLRVRVHLGTAEVLARVSPRGDGLARLTLEEPTIARGEDRFVLRSYSPVATIGGGRVLDPDPPRKAAWSQAAGLLSTDASERAAALIARRPAGVSSALLPLLLGRNAAECRAALAGTRAVATVGSLLVAAETIEPLRDAAVREVKRHHQRHPSEPGLSLETLRRSLRAPAPVVAAVLERLAEEGLLEIGAGLAAIPGFAPQLAEGGAGMDRVLGALEAAGLEPPSVPEIERELGVRGVLQVLRFAAREGKAVAVESDRYFSPRALEQFVQCVRELAATGAITPQDLRERLGLSRKYIIPLLEWADRSGVTRRMGDKRVLV